MEAGGAMLGHNSVGRTRCIFRAHGDRAYTKLRNAFLQDRRISDETRGLIARLLSLPDDWEVTVKSIIASGKAGRDKVYRMLNEAEEFGYIKPEQGRGDAGKFDRQLYMVSDDPDALIERAAQELHEMEAAHQPVTDFPEAVKVAENNDISPLPDLPLTACPLTVEPLPENRTHKKNIEDKINIINKLSDMASDDPPKAKRSKSAVPDAYPHDFEEFWKVYPRREGKAEACKSWQRLSLPQKRRAYVALKAQLSGLDAKRRDTRGNFCPLPATWINQGRFDDDVSSLSVAVSSPIASPTSKPEGMPDFVWRKIQADKAANARC